MNSKSLCIVALCLGAISCTSLRKEDSREPASDDKSRTLAALPAIEFERCSKKSAKNYLEVQLRQLPADYTRIQNYDSINALPPQCIWEAQKNFYGHYAICKSEESKPGISMVRPCLSESYVSISYNAFHDVMDCFGLNPREMYYQIMIESGFHINAINRTGFDSGMSQFTANGIKRVTANNLVERTRRLLLESSRASCQRISSIVGHFNIDAFSVQKRCAMISLPKNPYRAMFFGYLHTLLDGLVLDDILLSLPEIQEALTPKIRRQLLYLSYNRGMTGMMRLLRGYVESRQYFFQPITESDLDLSSNLSGIKEILRMDSEKRDLAKRAHIRNLSFAQYAVIHNSPYLSDMSAARDYIESKLGNACGEF